MYKIFTRLLLAAGFLLSVHVQATAINQGSLELNQGSYTPEEAGSGSFEDTIAFNTSFLPKGNVDVNLLFGVGQGGVSNENTALYMGFPSQGTGQFIASSSSGNFTELLHSNAYYYLVVTGDGLTTNNQFHTILTASPVPEPEQVTLMAAGLALLAFCVLRKSSRTGTINARRTALPSA